LVEMHGGTLVATSEGRGRGSHFVVSLPSTSQCEVRQRRQRVRRSKRRSRAKCAHSSLMTTSMRQPLWACC
jgi:hypothetical protein